MLCWNKCATPQTLREAANLFVRGPSWNFERLLSKVCSRIHIPRANVQQTSTRISHLYTSHKKSRTQNRQMHAGALDWKSTSNLFCCVKENSGKNIPPKLDRATKAPD